MAERAKLPVIQTVVASWRLLIAEWRFGMLLCLSLTVFMLLALPVWQSLVAVPLSHTGAMQWMPDAMISLAVWEFLMDAPLYMGLAVALVPLHRRILLGEERRLPFRFGRREVSYGAFLFLLDAGPVILITALMNPIIGLRFQIWKLGQDGVVPEIAGDVAMSVVLAGFAILIIYVYARFSLALPGMAVGVPAAIANSWRRSSGKGMRLVAVILLVSLPALFAIVLLYWALPGDFVPDLEGPILLPEGAPEDVDRKWPAPFVPPSGLTVLWAVLNMLVVLPEAAALSLVYKRLVGTDTESVVEVFS